MEQGTDQKTQLEDEADAISAFDAASYVFQMATELAGLSRRAGLDPLAAALEYAREIAAQALFPGPKGSQSEPE